MSTSDEAAQAVNQLTGRESGIWLVMTRDSFHLFDLDAGLVTRIPGRNAVPGSNDRPRPLRSIEICQVGARGYWTMNTDGWSDTIDFYWHVSSEIRRIERIPGSEATDGTR